MGTTAGILCTDLCQKRNIHIKRCLTTAPEKKVFLAEWKGKEVVLKLTSNWSNEFPELLAKYRVVRHHREFHWSEVSDIVHSFFAKCAHCDKLTRKLLEIADANDDGLITAPEIATTVGLLHHQEPALLMMLNDTNHSLDFFGYCGGVYAVEVLSRVVATPEPWNFLTLSVLPEELQVLDDFVNEHILEPIMALPLADKINNHLEYFWYCLVGTSHQNSDAADYDTFDVAYSFLQLVAEMSANQYGPLVSCDSHVGNFGFSNASLLKLMDLDFVFPLVNLEHRFSRKPCSSHNDCKVGALDQCTSLCNSTSGFCTPQRKPLFPDLQTICRVIFPQIFKKYLCCRSVNGFAYTRVLRAISFCTNLPVTSSLDALRHNIKSVRKELEKLAEELLSRK